MNLNFLSPHVFLFLFLFGINAGSRRGEGSELLLWPGYLSAPSDALSAGGSIMVIDNKSSPTSTLSGGTRGWEGP